MAIKKTITIDVDARQAISEMEELGSSFEDVFGEVQPLSTKIGEMEDALYRMAEAGDTGSKEFKDLSASVGKMKKIIIDTDMAVDGMSQTLSQNVGGALQGVASGFELAQGAMGAFGAGGEAVEEALLKVQSAMAMAQGLQGIRESVASFKALRTVVMSNVVVQKLLNFVMNLNPIGMIILAVGALGAAIALLFSPIKKLLQFMGLVSADAETAAEANKRLTATIEAQGAALDKLKAKQEQVHSDRMRQLKLQGASEEEIHNQILSNLKDQEANRKTSITNSKANVKDLQRAWEKALKEGDEESRKSLAEKLNSEKKNVRLLSAQYNEYTLSKQEEDQRYNASKADADAAATDKEKAELEKRRSNYKSYLDKKLVEERRIEDLRQSLIGDDLERNLLIRRTKFERELVDLKAGDEEKKLLEQELQRDLINIADAATPEKLRLADTEILGVQNKNMQIIESAQVTALKLDAIDKEAADRKKARNKEVASASVSVAMSGFQAVADLAKAFAGNSEKAQRRAFNIQKAANIAQATIETYKSATSAFSSFSAIPVVGVPLGIAAAGAAIAAGLANIKGIASTKFEGSGGGRPSAPAGVSIGGGGSGGNAAQFNVVGNTGINQLADSLGNQDNVTKAYVVAGDVTTAQSLDRNKVDTATL